MIGEDALDFEGGGTDEFLSKERNGLGARKCGEGRGIKCADIFIR